MFIKKPLAICVAIAISQQAFAEQAVFSMERVQVTATRSQQSIQDTAASVTVISDKEIEENMSNSIADLFQYTPGVDVQTNSRQGIQSINIRGIEGNQIKILVDGVSQPSQYDSGGTFINSGRVDVDIDMIKSVEVVKGAASSLHGSDALGGIVAFKTKDPSDFLSNDKDYGGHVKLNYSSADSSFNESVALANRLGDLETLIAYSRQDSSELDNFGDPDDRDNAANNLLVKLQYQLNENNRVEFTGEYVNSEIDSELSDDSYTDYTGEDSSDRYRLGVKQILNANSTMFDKLTWQVNYQSKKQNSITHRTATSTGNVQRKDYDYSEDGVQADIQFDKFVTLGSSEHYFTYGASLSTKDISNVNNEYNSISDDQLMFYMPDSSEFRYGLFVQDEITINKLILTPGLRFDSFDTDPGNNFPDDSYDTTLYEEYSDSAVTGRLGVLYNLNEQHKIFAQISQGFRAPDFKELFYSYGNAARGYASIPNPDLEAEESISYELGWRHVNAASSTEVSVFYSDYDNFIEYQSVGTVNDVTQYQSVNLDEATIKGAEIANKLDWHRLADAPEGISTRLVATYTEGEDGDGDDLADVNPWNAVIGFNYDAPAGSWGSSLKVSYTAKKELNDSTKFLPDSATVVDLTAYYIPIENLTLRAGIFNLSDEQYYHWGDVKGLRGTEEDESYSQAGRNFSLTAKYDF